MAVVVSHWDRSMTAGEIDVERQWVETVLMGFRDFPEIDDDVAGIEGIESVFFLGPSEDAGIEVLQTFVIWDVERKGDRIVAVHPHRDHWSEEPDYESKYRSIVEPTLAAFRTEAKAARAAMVTEYGGRIDKSSAHDGELPMLLMDVANLHTFYVETGATNHPAGPPVLPPPIPER